jgi:predicted GTPase
MVEAHIDKEIPTIAFMGKTGAGKSTLMNAVCWKPGTEYVEIARTKQEGEMGSCTRKVTVYPNMDWFDDEGKVNFVDVPGLDDSEGKDQEIVDEMVRCIKKNAPTIDLFLLVISAEENIAGSLQEVFQTYMHLLSPA